MEAAGEGAAVAAVALSEEQRQQRRARQGHFVQVNQYPPVRGVGGEGLGMGGARGKRPIGRG